jgi:hypothetical protein
MICCSCQAPFAGCTSFDGDSVIVTDHKISVFLPLITIESSTYTHCAVFHELSSGCPVDVHSCALSCIDPCFQYSPIALENNLSHLSAMSLAWCTDSLPCGEICYMKASNLHFILHHFLDLCALLLPLTKPGSLPQFTDVG